MTNETPPAKWIDDPHEIEHGQALNPEWVKTHNEMAQDLRKLRQIRQAKETAPVQATGGEAVAEVYRGGTVPFGYATCLQRWLPGANKLPMGTTFLYASPQTSAPATVSDEQIDQVLAQTMDAVAKEFGMEHALYLNTDVQAMPSLRRAFARNILALATPPTGSAEAKPK